MRKFVRRNRAPVTAGALIALTLVAGLVSMTVLYQWARSERARVVAQSQRASDALRQVTEEFAASLIDVREDVAPPIIGVSVDQEGAEVDALAITAVNLVRSLDQLRKRAHETSEFIEDMLLSVTPEKAQGADITLLKGILDDTAAKLERGEVDDEIVAAELHRIVGESYSRLTVFPEAERHLRRAIEIYTRIVGEDHLVTQSAMWALGLHHNISGRPEDAVGIFESGLLFARERFGDEDPYTLKTMTNLAIAYRESHQDDKAEPLLRQTLEIKQRVLGPEDLDTLVCMNSLGATCWQLEKYDEAATLFAHVAEARERLLGPDHPQTLATNVNLANAYRTLERTQEAEAIYTQVLPKLEEVLGPDHPHRLVCMNNYATLLKDAGRLEEAVPIFREGLERRRRLFPNESWEIMAAARNLGTALFHLDRGEEALPFFEESLVGFRSRFGDKSMEALNIVNDIGLIYQEMNDLEKAEVYLKEAADGKLETVGPESTWTVASTTNLGKNYLLMGRFQDARKYLEISVPAKREILGIKHPWTSLAIELLLETYRRLGMTAEARSLSEQYVSDCIAWADESDTGARPLNEIAWLLLTVEPEDVRDAARALQYAQRACDLEETAGGGDLWMYLDTLALAQHMTGDTNAAVETQRRAIALMPSPLADAGMPERLAEYESALAGEANTTTSGDDE